MRVYRLADDCDRTLLGITTPYIGITNENTTSIVALNKPDVNDIECGVISVKKVDKARGDWLGPNYDNGIVEYSAYYKGKLAGVACSSNWGIRSLLKMAEKHFAVQRLISSLQPNEGIIVVTQNLEDVLLKFDSKTDKLNFIGTMCRPIGLCEEAAPIMELLYTAPLIIEVQESINMMDDGKSFNFSRVNTLGLDYQFKTFILDSISIPKEMSGKDIRNMTIGYSIAAFNMMCKQNGEKPEDLATKLNNEYFSTHPKVDVDIPDGIISKHIPDGFTINADEIEAWTKEGELYLPMRDELITKKILSLYNNGYYFCIIEDSDFSLVKIKEGEEEKIEILNIQESTAEKLMETLPAYGYIKSTDLITDDGIQNNICAKACKVDRESIELFKRQTDKASAYFAVSTAYAAMILGGIESPDKETVDAAKQLSESMGESEFKWDDVLGGVQSYKFTVGLKPDPNIEQTARTRLEEELAESKDKDDDISR